MEGQTIIDSIGSREYSVILLSPAPVLAAGVHTVELGGQADTPALDEQDSILEADALTLPTLDVASSWGVPEIACTTLASLPSLSLLLSVLSVTPLIKTSALVSAVEWTHKISYLGLLVVDSSEPNLVWAREGIGTRNWNEFHRRGRVTTH
ncbi:hypothetical protein B0H14DRAFT_2588396 [Mycena olivaceomarginata]|nr:hypothetical protein B0H14DRAFT_2588396 [Mycena olivaceomarginata]